MVVTALKSDAEMARLATNPWFIYDGVTLDQFKILLWNTDFLIFFKNTAIVTVCVVAITMVVSILAAFALGRMKFWGSSVLATGIFLTYLVPDTSACSSRCSRSLNPSACSILIGAWCWSIRH